MTIRDLLWTEQVASPAHSNVPRQKTPLCCWLIRGSLRYHASPREQLFTERPAPLTHSPCYHSHPLLKTSLGSGLSCPLPQTSSRLLVPLRSPATPATCGASYPCLLSRPHAPGGDLSFLA